MGILKDVARVIRQPANQQCYKLGFEDGRSGNPRRVTGLSFGWSQERLEFYNRGYEDGRHQQLIDKLG